MVEPSPDEPGIDVLVVRDASDEQLIIDWAILVGDVVYNARSALDHAVWQLVGLNGTTPDRNTQFPTAISAAKFRIAAITGVHRYVQEAVREVEPWEHGAGHWLWVLTQLDNVDKHRLLLDINSSSNSKVLVQDPESE